MSLDLPILYGTLLTILGGIGLSATSENKETIGHAVAVGGIVGLALCGVVVVASMSYTLCTSSKLLCDISQFFATVVGFPSDNEPLRTKAFLASGWFGVGCLFFMLALINPHPITFKAMSFIGVVSVLVGGGLLLYSWVIT